MSSDLIEDVEDKSGATIMLTMKASGHALLTIMEDEEIHYDMVYENISANFRLPPTEEGLLLAEKIETGLRAWREQVKDQIKEKI